MKRPTMLAAAVALAGIGVPLAPPGPLAAWLTEEAGAIVMVMVPAAIVASFLVLYFEWRRRLMRRMRADHGEVVCDPGVWLCVAQPQPTSTSQSLRSLMARAPPAAGFRPIPPTVE